MEETTFIITLANLKVYNVVTCCYMHAVIMAEWADKEGIPTSRMTERVIYYN